MDKIEAKKIYDLIYNYKRHINLRLVYVAFMLIPFVVLYYLGTNNGIGANKYVNLLYLTPIICIYLLYNSISKPKYITELKEYDSVNLFLQNYIKKEQMYRSLYSSEIQYLEDRNTAIFAYACPDLLMNNLYMEIKVK